MLRHVWVATCQVEHAGGIERWISGVFPGVEQAIEHYAKREPDLVVYRYSDGDAYLYKGDVKKFVIQPHPITYQPC